MNNIKNSHGTNESCGVNGSYGVNESRGVNLSHGVNRSHGVNWSYGILNCSGVDRAIFLADKKRSFSIFGKKVKEDRFNEVWNVLFSKLNGWYPRFNNAVYLYQKCGNDWEKVNASEICGTLKNWDKPYKAWKDIPKEALEYIQNLPEFDAKMFQRITGFDIEVKEVSLVGSEVEVKVNGKIYKAKIIE